MDRDTAQLGTEIATQQEEILGERKQRAKRIKTGRAAMSSLGLPVRPGEDIDSERIEAANRMKRALQEFEQEKSHE